MKAYVFPGQGSQFSEMGKDLYDRFDQAQSLFELADRVLGFSLSSIMFSGSADDLQQTRVTQPAIYVHSVISALCHQIKPDMVAGHSLGEFSALATAGVFSFEDGLKLVYERALAMQEACDQTKGTMAAVLGLADEIVEAICHKIANVVPANYNCAGQLVISGEVNAVNEACSQLKEAGAKRALILPVNGAFHSPLMKSAEKRLASVIESTVFNTPSCPIYQNVSTTAVSDSIIIKNNLIAQLTSPVKWTQSIQNMLADGATSFTEVGPGKVLQGLIKKINADSTIDVLN